MKHFVDQNNNIIYSVFLISTIMLFDFDEIAMTTIKRPYVKLNDYIKQKTYLR